MSLDYPCTHELSVRQLAWLRYLSADSPNRLPWTHPAARRVLSEVAAICRTQLRPDTATLISDPVVIRDDGRVREVEVRGVIRYRMDRLIQAFDVHHVGKRGDWINCPNEQFSLSPFLCHPRWRAAFARAVRA